ncbi:Germin-like protein subfamily 1 member 18 [Theobroma cacao]|uniref:Germin-like protein subfamily 1 member 18 n=1 Tax=Theobroma cacao TaxID=3641 RepID=A0A061F275_THECC|nr:Germin-like protein subfamily 1 member 18 [Theobroma cacao]
MLAAGQECNVWTYTLLSLTVQAPSSYFLILTVQGRLNSMRINGEEYLQTWHALKPDFSSLTEQYNLEQYNQETCLTTMKGVQILVAFVLLALVSSLASASDPSPLQDFCVAINDAKNGVFVNGKFCKDPKLANADDFFFSGLNKQGNTSNQLGSKVTPVNVEQIPGLNTLGISFARVDYAPYGGLNPPHTHPRATEILVVVEGTLYVGFVTSNPDNRLITKVLYPGDVFVFPVGLIHFQFNKGNTNAVAFAGLSSQNPGVITIANAVFGSNPAINPEVLAKAFQLEKNIERMKQMSQCCDEATREDGDVCTTEAIKMLESDLQSGVICC